MSGDWQRLHRVRGVCSGSLENHWVTRLNHKTEAEDSMRRCGQPGRFNRPGGAARPPGAGQISRASLTAQGGSLTALAAGAEMLRSGGHASGRKACVEAKQVAVAGHPSDEDIPKICKSSLEGHVSLVISEG
jgi:hypothetical protein